MALDPHSICHVPQAEKQTYGGHCGACDAIWDGYQVPAPAEVIERMLGGLTSCPFCHSTTTFCVMPWSYEQMKTERRTTHAAASAQAGAGASAGEN